MPHSASRPTRRRLLKGLGLTGAALALPSATSADEGKAAGPVEAGFRSAWPEKLDRPWAGPEFWANRLQDWRVRGGWLECVRTSAPFTFRTVHLLTHRLRPGDAEFDIRVRVRRLDEGASPGALVGFLVGAGGKEMDYRAAALVHSVPGPGAGKFCGINLAGQAVFLSLEDGLRGNVPGTGELPQEVHLRLTGSRHEEEYLLTVTAHDAGTGRLLQSNQLAVSPDLAGNMALVSHPGSGSAHFAFRDLTVSGPKVEADPERRFGPILCTQYTVHDRILKLTAQLAPIGPEDERTARLEIRRGDRWRTVDTAEVTVPGFTAAFRVSDWNPDEDVPFRVSYQLRDGSGDSPVYSWLGTIKKDPVEKETLVVASLSCVQQVDGSVGGGLQASYGWKNRVWFPHADLTPNVAKHEPDLYYFAGDQIYEGNPTRPVRGPVEEAHFDYLYKWYLWCWAFGDLVRHTPCVCIPDDHDVYQGNIWGGGGVPSGPNDPAGLQGGYGMPGAWLNMMQRTQTSHLPDPIDPAPLPNGMGVYFTSLVWGGVGFAILEDRKFKSVPAIVQARKTPDNHILDKDYDTRKADLPGAQLLGDRQLEFLREFAGDWRGQKMKAVLSQTIFCNLQISSRGETVGELDRDLDSNGWPQSGRAAALREMRRGFMVHLAGDQHLSSAIHHGIDEWEDAPWSLCSPAISNLYIRFWNPDYLPVDGRVLRGPFTGRYADGFHNRITVYAVANPVPSPKPGEVPEPVELHRKATGYSIVRFNKTLRTITLESWPRYVDPTDPKSGAQYPGWPITIKQTDNYARQPVGFLPTLVVRGAEDPVLHVIDEIGGELVYALRLRGREYRPPVFKAGRYTLKVEAPERRRSKEMRNIDSGGLDDDRDLEVEL